MKDVPSKINLKDLSDACQWANNAMASRPYRTVFFEIISRKISTSKLVSPRILELGSGPGFLIEQILKDNSTVVYEALDFSEAMHNLARVRLGTSADNVKFHLSSFKEDGWHAELGKFDFIVTMQAVHELRHKDHAPTLFLAIRDIMNKGGLFLYCDHHCGEGGISNSQLYMLPQEQEAALRDCFANVSKVYAEGSLILWEAC